MLPRSDHTVPLERRVHSTMSSFRSEVFFLAMFKWILAAPSSALSAKGGTTSPSTTQSLIPSELGWTSCNRNAIRRGGRSPRLHRPQFAVLHAPRTRYLMLITNTPTDADMPIGRQVHVYFCTPAKHPTLHITPALQCELTVFSFRVPSQWTESII